MSVSIKNGSDSSKELFQLVANRVTPLKGYPSSFLGYFYGLLNIMVRLYNKSIHTF